ncbi:threonylcarbamoyl-AMP synthase [Nocardioides mangrovicus]|uniref:Threonylcarbamoyl-AMP synthase n=1 Tax=Nocardioides mangrovicus TaxID=2478913 RepID=A0A3L8P730_9ACTN|nr:L-threonylcarbamoyladenylate synthase [Nocardioides mangrovicus]RLV50797.1 threonylcarbamoyl-AMP synthase [Nocardioides mangrovicus]
MARYYDVHPVDPQPRAIAQVVQLLRDDGLLAYPTDSGYALGIRLGNRDGLERMRDIRQLDERHHFTLVCKDFAQMGRFVHLGNAEFRAVKAATPGPYTFILPATGEVPKAFMHPKKRTVGVRIPEHRVVAALLEELDEPLLSTTLILPDQTDPMTMGWEVKEELDQKLDAVLDGGEETDSEPTTVVDFSSGAPEVTRVGRGDPDRFS